jgi:hypothetical protein
MTLTSVVGDTSSLIGQGKVMEPKSYKISKTVTEPSDFYSQSDDEQEPEVN